MTRKTIARIHCQLVPSTAALGEMASNTMCQNSMTLEMVQ
jgi:hypothetical protein